MQSEEGAFEAILPPGELEGMYDRICAQELAVRGGGPPNAAAAGGSGRRAPLNARLAAALGLSQVLRCLSVHVPSHPPSYSVLPVDIPAVIPVRATSLVPQRGFSFLQPVEA